MLLDRKVGPRVQHPNSGAFAALGQTGNKSCPFISKHFSVLQSSIAPFTGVSSLKGRRYQTRHCTVTERQETVLSEADCWSWRVFSGDTEEGLYLNKKQLLT